MSAGTAPARTAPRPPTGKPARPGAPPWLRRVAAVNEAWTFGVLVLLVAFFTAARPAPS